MIPENFKEAIDKQFPAEPWECYYGDKSVWKISRKGAEWAVGSLMIPELNKSMEENKKVRDELKKARRLLGKSLIKTLNFRQQQEHYEEIESFLFPKNK